ncbi:MULTISPECIES: hypothetical protein [unclassified Paenarthrobacter]|uniref:hypothetical protein n=1 Tax=unclassified Paenarthrobacter TaxID=2634190 RepID=UPI003CF0C1E6
MNRPDSNSPDQSANNDDDDAVWLDLVARLEATDSGPGPGSAPDDATASDADGTPSAPTPAPGAGDRPKAFRDFDPLGLAAPATTPASAEAAAVPAEEQGRPSGPRDFEVDDDDDGFVPEEPPSLAGTEPLTMLAWLGAVGGPLALLFTAMFWRSAPLAAILGIVAAFVASVIYLIMRLPHEKDEDDDGARI